MKRNKSLHSRKSRMDPTSGSLTHTFDSFRQYNDIDLRGLELGSYLREPEANKQSFLPKFKTTKKLTGTLRKNQSMQKLRMEPIVKRAEPPQQQTLFEKHQRLQELSTLSQQ